MKFKTVNWITNKKSSSYKPQAASFKRQAKKATSRKPQATEATSLKQQANLDISYKLQATSNKRLDS